MPCISSVQLEKIRDELKRPEGTLEFKCDSRHLMAPATEPVVIHEIPTGRVLFRLERGPSSQLHFVHSSPGTGTRIASMDLAPFKNAVALRIALVWSPEEIRLFVADADDPKHWVSVKGTISNRKFKVGSNGSVCQIGDDGVEVMGSRTFVNGNPILEPTAVESWDETLKAVNILLTGSSPEGYIFENLCVNLVIMMLVTGFETYCKKRFLELQDEGVSPDFNALVKAFSSRSEREGGGPLEPAQEVAAGGNPSLAELLGRPKVDFQNYNKCKLAWNKGYGIRFGEDLGLPNTVLGEVKNFIEFRHRIVHVSPLIGMLNQPHVPPEEPVFANRESAQRAVKCFDAFIRALHEATLRLRPR